MHNKSFSLLAVEAHRLWLDAFEHGKASGLNTADILPQLEPFTILIRELEKIEERIWFHEVWSLLNMSDPNNCVRCAERTVTVERERTLNTVRLVTGFFRLDDALRRRSRRGGYWRCGCWPCGRGQQQRCAEPPLFRICQFPFSSDGGARRRRQCQQ